MNRRIALFVSVAALVLTGCSTREGYIGNLRKSHVFQPGLYVADVKIPHLTQGQWETIQDQYASRVGYVYRDALRVSKERVYVNLTSTANKHRGLKLEFDLRDGAWVENGAAAQQQDYL